jgi:hypothetical protein
MNKKEFIDKILFDYDLIETDEDRDGIVSGALLDATLYKEQECVQREYKKEYTPLRRFYAILGFSHMVVYAVIGIITIWKLF